MRTLSPPERCSCLVVVLLLCPVAVADVVHLEPSKDNSLIESSSGALSNGGEAFLFVGRTNQDSESLRRGVVAFDLKASPQAPRSRR